MATTIAARAVVSKLVEKIRIPSLASRLVPAAATTTTRSFNTNALCEFDDYDRASEVHSDSSRRSDSFLSSQGVFVPFNSTRSLSQVLNLMEQIQILDNVPFLPASAGPSEAVLGFRRGWEVREDDDALHLRVDMPGLGKEHVKVSIEQNTLVIQGEGEKEETGEERESAGRRYRSCIVLPPESFRTDQIRAEMKNGVLKVVVPKLKEELKDVFEVKIKPLSKPRRLRPTSSDNKSSSKEGETDQSRQEQIQDTYIPICCSVYQQGYRCCKHYC